MIGKLDQRITFERLAETSDGGGGVVRAWAALSVRPTVWAAVRPRVAREGVETNRMTSAYLAEFTIRNRTDLNETDRIIWKGEAWNIRGILRQGERQMYLQIEAERGVAS